MDPFHVIHLAAEKLTLCRQRVQQVTCGHRGRSGDPLFGIRRTLLTRIGLLTDKQKTRLRTGLDAHEEHLAVSVTYAIYQELIDAYDQERKRDGKILMYKVLKKIHTGLPAGLAELAQLGRSLWARRKEILAYFDTGASNGPVEAINGRLEHLRGIAWASATSPTTSCGHSSTQDSSQNTWTHSESGRASLPGRRRPHLGDERRRGYRPPGVSTQQRDIVRGLVPPGLTMTPSRQTTISPRSPITYMTGLAQSYSMRLDSSLAIPGHSPRLVLPLRRRESRLFPARSLTRRAVPPLPVSGPMSRDDRRLTAVAYRDLSPSPTASPANDPTALSAKH